MFKKPAEFKSRQRLSGADRKKLKRAVRDRFLVASDADIDVLLPPKVEIILTKYTNRVLVYSLEGDCPMFYDIDGRGSEIFPTVYSLWKVPYLLPSFVLKGGEVSLFVIGGADLMFPGIHVPSEGLVPFSAGESWAAVVPGNPAPIAIGTTTMSSTEAIKAGLRGKALKINHCYGDTLWEFSENRHVPNAGFLDDVVFADPALLSFVHASDSCENGFQDDHGNAINTIIVNDTTSPIPDTVSDKDPELSTEASEQVTTAMTDLQIKNESSVDNQHVLSLEEVDLLMDKCLLQSLHATVRNRDLPIPGSTLWSRHVLPCRPPGITLDIKKSSHKKLSKWLQSKSTSGLISVKEDKHKKELILVSVNHRHPDYTSFKPEKKKQETSEQSIEGVASEEQLKNLLDVEEIYKPSTHVIPILAAVGAETQKFYSAVEASQIIFAYIEMEKLVAEADGSVVVLDACLCDALYKGAIKKGSMYPTEIHKKDVGHTFISRMQAHCRVTKGSDSVIRKGTLKPIQILTERRNGNKKVTKLAGLELFLIDAKALVSELRKKFACSTTVAELPGKKGLEVLVQGGVLNVLARHLVEQYGVQKRISLTKYYPLDWSTYFEQEEDIVIPNSNNIFHIYKAGNEGPVVLCLHGGGFSALSFALSASKIKEKACVVALDLRDMGSHLQRTNLTFPLSLGGSVAAHVAAKKGTAMASLVHMQKILSNRRQHFSTVENAIEWSVKGGTLRNLESARVSIPSTLKFDDSRKCCSSS